MDMAGCKRAPASGGRLLDGAVHARIARAARRVHWTCEKAEVRARTLAMSLREITQSRRFEPDA
jgi:hypothetical protein